MAGINLLAVLVAAMVTFVVGGIWYAPLLFGEGWQTHPRLPDHLRVHKPALIFGIGFLLSLIAALMFYRSGVSKGKNLELSLINGGFHAVQFMALGLVFANF